jgi:hypothetical protein
MAMSDRRQALTSGPAWLRACSGGVEALVDWLALSLIGAVTGHRFDDRHGPSQRRNDFPQEDSQA